MMEKTSHIMSLWKRVFQEREMKNIKALRWEGTWYILRTERKTMCLEYQV